MSSSHWFGECLEARIRSLENDIRRVANKDHPYPEPDVIYAALLYVLEDRSTHLRDAISKFSLPKGGSKDSEDSTFKNAEFKRRMLEMSLKIVAQQLDEVAKVFSLADRVDSPRIPFEIVRSLSWVANLVLDERCSTVVRLDPTYNYSIESCRLRFEDPALKWKIFWDRAIQDSHSMEDAHGDQAGQAHQEAGGGKTILLLGIPSAEAGSILVHALAAHEFGHALLVKYQKSFQAICDNALAEAKRKYNARLQEYLEEQYSERSRSNERSSRDELYDGLRRKIDDRLENITNSWLSEMFSDMLRSWLGPHSWLPSTVFKSDRS